MRELLRIVIKGSICTMEALFHSDADREKAAAAIIGFMCEDEAFAKLMAQYVALFMLRKGELKSVTEKAKAAAKKKMSN